jgi:NAD(P)-dependent dehydrogenase (short-subunit alcohol dehydrogenase family)
MQQFLPPARAINSALMDEMKDKAALITGASSGIGGGMDEQAYAAFLEHSKTTHPLGRVGALEEIAELIYFLAWPRAGWITGGSFPIDGGRQQTCAR